MNSGSVMKRIALLSAFTSISLTSFSAGGQETASENEEEAERIQEKASEIASITTDRGIVTRPGRFVIEPAFSYANSNSTVVAIEGYTVVPALLVGLINISEVQRDIFVGALTMKYGITSRLETTVRVPYLDIHEDLRERQAFQGTPVDTLTESSGEGLGMSRRPSAISSMTALPAGPTFWAPCG